MGMVVLAAAYFLSQKSAQLAAQMRVGSGERKAWRVVIDPGHGGVDPGKVSAAGDLEKDINLQIARRLERLLESADVEVSMTRETDEGLYREYSENKKLEDLKNRCAKIRELEPDCVVSIHQNSYHETDVRGAQVFYYADSPEGEALAGHIQEWLLEVLGEEYARETRGNTSYYMLSRTECPIVIAECGFLSNAEEAALLTDEEYQERLAWALHMGVMNYLSDGSAGVPRDNKAKR